MCHLRGYFPRLERLRCSLEPSPCLEPRELTCQTEVPRMITLLDGTRQNNHGPAAESDSAGKRPCSAPKPAEHFFCIFESSGTIYDTGQGGEEQGPGNWWHRSHRRR